MVLGFATENVAPKANLALRAEAVRNATLVHGCRTTLHPRMVPRSRSRNSNLMHAASVRGKSIFRANHVFAWIRLEGDRYVDADVKLNTHVCTCI